MALSPDHQVSAALAKDDAELAAFIAECRRQGTTAEAIETGEKRGYDTGLKVKHPLIEGATLPVFVANFVLIGWLLGMQNARGALAIMLTINLTNIALDLLFVVYLGMDVDGVAAASLAATKLSPASLSRPSERSTASIGATPTDAR